MKTKILTVFVAFALASCVNVVKVKEEKLQADKTTANRSVDGIPFYVKTEMFKQVTVYRQTWLRATLTVSQKLVDTKENKEVTTDAGTQTFTRNIPKTRVVPGGEVDKLTKLKEAILKANTQPSGDTATLISDFGKIDAIEPGNLPEPELIGNAIDSTWVVDRSRTYYLNAPLPGHGHDRAGILPSVAESGPAIAGSAAHPLRSASFNASLYTHASSRPPLAW